MGLTTNWRAADAGRARRRAAGAVALSGLACLVAGCGSSTASKPSAASGHAVLTKAELIAKANANCAVAIGAAPTVPVKPGNAALVAGGAAMTAYLDKLKPIVDKLRDADVQLTPPASAKPAWNDYFSYVKLAADDLDQADMEIHSGNANWLTDFDDIESNPVELAYKAHVLGATTCASDQLAAVYL